MVFYKDLNYELVSNLEALCNVDILYVDITFEYCAKHFLQLFSIQGYFNRYLLGIHTIGFWIITK